ncbi:hypothetical protein ACLI09_15505 [Flavobacterium sp. RHBU_24]|uniref:hypothetical protein n=1 Tax=Flavobacterium sp. RHBU_24 TaxID=3391185 RepID=UPI0039852CA1
MKHLLMAALLMTGVATFAQTTAKTENTALTTPKREKVTPETQTQKLSEELALTAEQQVKVRALYEQEAKARAALKEERKAAMDDAAKEALRAKAKEDKEAFRAKMKEILTTEQFANWKTFKAKQPGTMGDKGNSKFKSKGGAIEKAQPGQLPKN